MEILHMLTSPQVWEEFYQSKCSRHAFGKKEQEQWRIFIAEKRYMVWAEALASGNYILPEPEVHQVSKSGTGKKRQVYTYPTDLTCCLKLIAHLLYRYDCLFSDSCYAFRSGIGTQDALRNLRPLLKSEKLYCLKADIHDFFNSIDQTVMLGKLSFLQNKDPGLFGLFTRMLNSEKGRGVMAGMPTAPFMANVYLSDLDKTFATEAGYFRYSDDILILADTKDGALFLLKKLEEELKKLGLSLNPDKTRLCQPGEGVEFLGFCVRGDSVDLSAATQKKAHDRIRRKARALRRWAAKKDLSYEKGAKGLISAMNHKFYDVRERGDFCWSRYFFPNLTTDAGLADIDHVMQRYIRYCVTGRHNKGNYRISYEQMKQWGYRPLVSEYYKHRNTFLR